MKGPEGRCPQTAGSRLECKIVAVAASAGGLKALSGLLAELPGDFPAPIAVVQHLDPSHRSLMAEILNRRTDLWVKEAQEGENLLAGTVYVAPPNRHFLVTTDRRVSLTESELVHFLRPSADLLFESVAACYGPRAVAVVLTGTGGDGSMGVQAVKARGGTVLAQDEATSEHFGMPSAAIRTGCVDRVLALEALAGAIEELAGSVRPEPVRGGRA